MSLICEKVGPRAAVAAATVFIFSYLRWSREGLEPAVRHFKILNFKILKSYKSDLVTAVWRLGDMCWFDVAHLCRLSQLAFCHQLLDQLVLFSSRVCWQFLDPRAMNIFTARLYSFLSVSCFFVVLSFQESLLPAFSSPTLVVVALGRRFNGLIVMRFATVNALWMYYLT